MLILRIAMHILIRHACAAAWPMQLNRVVCDAWAAVVVVTGPLGTA